MIRSPDPDLAAWSRSQRPASPSGAEGQPRPDRPPGRPRPRPPSPPTSMRPSTASWRAGVPASYRPTTPVPASVLSGPRRRHSNAVARTRGRCRRPDPDKRTRLVDDVLTDPQYGQHFATTGTGCWSSGRGRECGDQATTCSEVAGPPVQREPAMGRYRQAMLTASGARPGRGVFIWPVAKTGNPLQQDCGTAAAFSWAIPAHVRGAAFTQSAGIGTSKTADMAAFFRLTQADRHRPTRPTSWPESADDPRPAASKEGRTSHPGDWRGHRHSRPAE